MAKLLSAQRVPIFPAPSTCCNILFLLALPACFFYSFIILFAFCFHFTLFWALCLFLLLLQQQKATTTQNVCNTGHSLATTLHYTCIPVALCDTNCFIHMPRTHNTPLQLRAGVGQQQQQHALA